VVVVCATKRGGNNVGLCDRGTRRRQYSLSGASS
jgi:hypothetical protein